MPSDVGKYKIASNKKKSIQTSGQTPRWPPHPPPPHSFATLFHWVSLTDLKLSLNMMIKNQKNVNLTNIFSPQSPLDQKQW